PLQATSSRHPINNERTLKAQRTCIQGATSLHPTVVTVRDHQGQWLTVRDSDDRAADVRAGFSAQAHARRSFGILSNICTRRLAVGDSPPDSVPPPAVPAEARC